MTLDAGPIAVRAGHDKTPISGENLMFLASPIYSTVVFMVFLAGLKFIVPKTFTALKADKEITDFLKFLAILFVVYFFSGNLLILSFAFVGIFIFRRTDKTTAILHVIAAMWILSSRGTQINLPITNTFLIIAGPIKIFILLFFLMNLRSLFLVRAGHAGMVAKFTTYFLIYHLMHSATGALTFTEGLRIHVSYAINALPIFLLLLARPDWKSFRLFSIFLVSIGLLAVVVGIFETLFQWLLVWSAETQYTDRSALFLGQRAGFVRAKAFFVHPLVFGAFLIIPLMLSLSLRRFTATNTLWWVLVMACFVVGLFTPLSRGAWIGAALGVLTYYVTGKSGTKNLAKLSVMGVIGFAMLLMTPAGETVLKLLPFVGEASSETVDYRKLWLIIGFEEFLDKPIFGNLYYLEAPRLQALLQGEGLVDPVNIYMGVLLSHGLVGFILFFAPLFLIMIRIRRFLKLVNPDLEIHTIGRGVLAAIVGFALNIATAALAGEMPMLIFFIMMLGAIYLDAATAEHERLRTKAADMGTQRPKKLGERPQQPLAQTDCL